MVGQEPSRGFVATAPSGGDLFVWDLEKFALLAELTRAQIYNVLHGRQKTARGWLLREATTEEYLEHSCRWLEAKWALEEAEGFVEPTPEPDYWYVCISPADKEYLVRDLGDFCEEHGLSERSLRKVMYGSRQQVRGWRVGRFNANEVSCGGVLQGRAVLV